MSGAGIYIKTPSGLVAAATVPGKQGSQGPQSSLTAGPVTTGAPGTNAAATITGAGPVQTLNLTIPRGNTGDPTAYELRGTGMPEGVVTASPATYYTDTAITNGAWRWAKKTGAGNTGWKVVDGDTGKRLITATMLSGWTCAWANIVRKNDVVEVIVSGLNGSAATDGYFMTLPAGFRDSGVNASAPTSGIATGTGFTSVTVVYSTGVCNAGAARPTSGQWRHIFTTADPWPTTIPGVAA